MKITGEAKAINRTRANEFWYELFIRKGLGWLPVLTGSMTPTLRPGDQILITYAGAYQITFGDIFLFRRHGEFIVHRVLKKWENGCRVCFLEQGDARHAPGLVSGNRVIGRVELVYRQGKILDFTTVFSRFTSLILSVWLYLSSGIVYYLRRPRNRAINRTGDKASRVLLLLSNLLIRGGSAVWYLSGLFTLSLAQNHVGKGKHQDALGFPW